MIDKAIVEFDKALRTVFAPARTARAVPVVTYPKGSSTKQVAEMPRT